MTKETNATKVGTKQKKDRTIKRFIHKWFDFVNKNENLKTPRSQTQDPLSTGNLLQGNKNLKTMSDFGSP